MAPVTNHQFPMMVWIGQRFLSKGYERQCFPYCQLMLPRGYEKQCFPYCRRMLPRGWVYRFRLPCDLSNLHHWFVSDQPWYHDGPMQVHRLMFGMRTGMPSFLGSEVAWTRQHVERVVASSARQRGDVSK